MDRIFRDGVEYTAIGIVTYSEEHFVQQVLSLAPLAYPGWHLVPFDPLVDCGFGILRKPDLALVAEDLSTWFVIEAEIAVHSLPMLQGVKCRLPLLWHGGIAFSSLRGVECMVLQTVTDRSLDIWVRSPDVTLTVLRETLEEIFSALQDFCATAYPIVVLDELCLSPAHMQKYRISAEAFKIVGYLLQDCLLAHKNSQARISSTHPNDSTHVERVIDILGIALTLEHLKALVGPATPASVDTLVTLLITPSLEPQQSLGLPPGDIQLVDASLGSEFAKYVLHRFRREDS